MKTPDRITDKQERKKQAITATWIGFGVNMILSIGKIAAGIFGRSSAMIADGIHSFSDFVTDVIVIVFVGISSKGKDSDHRYGHGKYETFATLLVGVALVVVAVGICWSGIEKIIQSAKGELLERPTWLAFIAAIVSIIGKESLYWYTIYVGKRINSQAVIANAWHHRSDAFSSIGTLLGISGAMFLGDRWRILDPIAAIVVSYFIVSVAFKLIKPSFDELLERSLPQPLEDEIMETLSSCPYAETIHDLKTRKIGNDYAIEFHIKVEGNMPLSRAHEIATGMENALFEKYGKDTHIAVHMEPIEEAMITSSHQQPFKTDHVPYAQIVMKKILFTLLAIGLLFPAFAQENGSNGLLGAQWSGPQKQSRIQFFRHNGNDTFYAKIMWIAPGQQQTDSKDPDRELRSQPLVGLVVADSIVYLGNNQWQTNRMYLPEEGMHVKALITLMPNRDTIDIKGSKLGVSKTSVMSRVPISEE